MEKYDIIGETEEEKGIFINGQKYSYSISKSENKEETIIIKLYDSSQKSNIYFTYEATFEKLTKDIKFLTLCENLDEMITSLNNIFSMGNAKVEENNGNFNLELKFIGSGIIKKSFVQLNKYESKEYKNELEIKIKTLENKYNELFNKYEELKKQNENNIRHILKELIFDEDIKMKFFGEMERLFLSKYNLNDFNKYKEDKSENDIINKTQNIINNKEGKINEEKKVKRPEEKYQEKKEEIKNIGLPKTIMLMKFISKLDKYSPFLSDQDIYEIGKVSKRFYKPCLEKLKEINLRKLSKEEKELESINESKEKLITKFTLGKVSGKAIEELNEKNHIEYFQKEKAPEEVILLAYRILFQLINKEKNILKEKNNEEFWKLFRENMLKNSENGIGNYLRHELKYLDFSEENIYKLKCLCEGQEGRLNVINNISKKDYTFKFILFLIRESLEYININIGKYKHKQVIYSEAYNKYLKFIINKRNDNLKKLDNLISKA